MNAATLISKHGTGNATRARHYHYRLVPPHDGAGYVVVSAATVPYSGPETYIFRADETGKITDWMEMDGSYRGGLDPVEALRRAGYEVIPAPAPDEDPGRDLHLSSREH